MKQIIFTSFILILCTLGLVAQVKTGDKRFPGISRGQFEQLRTAKKVMALPLPTWLPAGFKMEKIEMKVGARIPIQDRVLNIIYSRPAANGKMQRFALEAGFDGLGDIGFDATRTLRSPVGRIELIYEPIDPD